MIDTPAQVAARTIEHACKLILKLLRARGCDDPEGLLAEALLEAAMERQRDLERTGALVKLSPANDTNPRSEWFEDLLD